jgi:hypothetical protein
MCTRIRCEKCGQLVDYDEETDGPALHQCVDDFDTDELTLRSLDFDNDTFPDDEDL